MHNQVLHHNESRDLNSFCTPSSWTKWSLIHTCTSVHHHRRPISYSRISLNSWFARIWKSGNDVCWAWSMSSTYRSPLSRLSLLQDDDPSTLEFNRTHSAPVDICSFDGFHDNLVDLWLTFVQITDVQHSLQDIDMAHSGKPYDFSRSPGFGYRCGFISVTAVSSLTRSFEPFDFLDRDQQRELLRDGGQVKVVGERLGFILLRLLHQSHSDGKSTKYVPAGCAGRMRNCNCHASLLR